MCFYETRCLSVLMHLNVLMQILSGCRGKLPASITRDFVSKKNFFKS